MARKSAARAAADKPVEQTQVTDTTNTLEEKPASRKGPPAQDPLMGDKTPAVVEYYRDNDPAEYKRRYKGRKTHLGSI